jgi:hypothetical protein
MGVSRDKTARERLPDVIFAHKAVAGIAAQRCGSLEFSDANFDGVLCLQAECHGLVDVSAT